MEDSRRGRRGAAPTDPESGAPPFSRLVYVMCPECGRQIEEPFNPEGGPLVFVHRHSKRRNARLLVLPSEQLAMRIPHGTSMERALSDAIRRAS